MEGMRWNFVQFFVILERDHAYLCTLFLLILCLRRISGVVTFQSQEWSYFKSGVSTFQVRSDHILSQEWAHTHKVKVSKSQILRFQFAKKPGCEFCSFIWWCNIFRLCDKQRLNFVTHTSNTSIAHSWLQHDHSWLTTWSLLTYVHDHSWLPDARKIIFICLRTLDKM